MFSTAAASKCRPHDAKIDTSSAVLSPPSPSWSNCLNLLWHSVRYCTKFKNSVNEALCAMACPLGQAPNFAMSHRQVVIENNRCCCRTVPSAATLWSTRMVPMSRCSSFGPMEPTCPTPNIASVPKASYHVVTICTKSSNSIFPKLKLWPIRATNCGGSGMPALGSALKRSALLIVPVLPVSRPQKIAFTFLRKTSSLQNWLKLRHRAPCPKHHISDSPVFAWKGCCVLTLWHSPRQLIREKPSRPPMDRRRPPTGSRDRLISSSTASSCGGVMWSAPLVALPQALK
mmetsp:Transcript_28366/g.80135  ORF Transcript_28366/g.80135 Transcript_28366/m.80135 type:complete len:287 (-) Transcript_28366:569-1429(-)